METIQEAIEVLKHLNPKPGAQFTAENMPYVVPDIVVERSENGEYDSPPARRLDAEHLHQQALHRHVPRPARPIPKDREFLKRKIQSAQWLIEAIEQRRSTLDKVTRAIIQHQQAFLDKGPEHIEPLKMQQIADQVGVHVTTVSRAVETNGCRRRAASSPSNASSAAARKPTTGEEVAWETIKQKLLEIIGNEDKANPLSDEDLVDKLQRVRLPGRPPHGDEVSQDAQHSVVAATQGVEGLGP